MTRLLKWLPRRRWLRWMVLGLAALVLVLAVLAGVRAFLLRDRIALAPLLLDGPPQMPTHLAELPDGSGEMAVTEKVGRILRFHPDRSRPEGVFLDLSDRVVIEGYEDGLFSIAFHPAFADNRRFYVSYTAARPRRLLISEFIMDAASRTGDPQSERVLIEVGKPNPNHNGGGLAFAPDGTLYVSVGDSGKTQRAQSPKNAYGTILRIDVDGADGERPYGIPPDNPFADAGGRTMPEVWAFGFRNPWRFSFDRETGALYAGDVGSERFEEINRVERGGNHGWDRMEGLECLDPEAGCNAAGFVRPLAAMPRFVTRAVIGGFVYRGSVLRSLRGRYVFGTLFRGLYSIDPETSETISVPDVLLFRPRGTYGPNDGEEIRTSSLAEDLRGELYVLDLKGGIYRIVRE